MKGQAKAKQATTGPTTSTARFCIVDAFQYVGITGVLEEKAVKACRGKDCIFTHVSGAPSKTYVHKAVYVQQALGRHGIPGRCVGVARKYSRVRSGVIKDDTQWWGLRWAPNASTATWWFHLVLYRRGGDRWCDVALPHTTCVVSAITPAQRLRNATALIFGNVIDDLVSLI